MSIGKIKTNVTHLGSSINNSVQSTVQSTVHKVGKRTYDSDDELISHYQHDLKRAIKALRYISSQINLLANKAIPRMFKSHMKSVELFSKLIGANSLYFDDLEQYYQQFDILQAESEVPMVHPKERQFEIPSLSEQLYTYMTTLDNLTSKVLDDWGWFQQENKIRMIAMDGHLRDALKLINKRNKKQHSYEKIHKKLEKLMKKTSPLDDKEQKSMVSLEKELKQYKYVFEKLDEKLKTVLPHLFLLLEEFIDSLSKITLFKQFDTYNSIKSSLDYFSGYYGLMDKTDNYELIIDAWENAMTPARLQIKTFITIIKNKDPEIIDREIDDEDKTLKAGQMWNKLNRRVTEHKFSLNATDQRNGLFNGYLIADPLDAFLEYQNPNQNPSETYYPKLGPKKSELTVPEIVQPKGAPPPLPTRENNPRSIAGLTSPRIGFPISLPNSPNPTSIPSTPVSGGFDGRRSFNNSDDYSVSDSESIISDNDDFSDNDDESKSLLSNTKSISTSHFFDDTTGKNSKLAKVYNSSKSQIKEAPIAASKDSYPIDVPKNDDAFTQASSVTHKLDEFTKFFDKVLSLKSIPHNTMVTAKYDFSGQEPGDLSFKAGDQIELVYNFQNLSSADTNDSWFIGVAHNKTQNPKLDRIGLVPGNYLSL